MKLLRSLAGHTFNDHKTNDSIRRELQTKCILDKIDEYRKNWLLHLQRMPQNRIPSKSYCYRPQGNRTDWEIEGTLEKAAVTVLTDGPNDPTLDLYDDDDDVTLRRRKFILRVSDTRFSRSTPN
jgi:hypothetical protein